MDFNLIGHKLLLLDQADQISRKKMLSYSMKKKINNILFLKLRKKNSTKGHQ